MSFQAADPRLFFSRNDAQDPRFGDIAKALPSSLSSSSLEATLEEGRKTFGASRRHFVLAGYPDDEGIRTNGGRPGAAQAPDAIRRPLYKMTPSFLRPKTLGPNVDFVLWDLGNLQHNGVDLAIRHEKVREYSLSTLNSGARWIGLGGGHDYGYPDAAAFIEWCQNQNSGQNPTRPLVINFDAHLDVRPVHGGISSGTPFYRMLEAYPAVDFAEIGIQSHCNSRAHVEWARSRGARILTQEEVESSGEEFSTLVLRTLGDWALRPRPVYLSIDIDGFSSSVAPGCSQSWATGFMPRDFFPCLQILARRLDVRSLGIYEVSPPLDQDDRTAKLAAQIVHRVIEAF